MRIRLLILAALLVLVALPAAAAPSRAQDMIMAARSERIVRASPTPPARVIPTPPPRVVDPYALPDLLSFAGGYYDFNENHPRNESIDIRLEHRWGMSLLPKLSDYFRSWNPYVQMHPIVGMHVTTDSAFYGFGGLAFDFLIGDNFIITWSEAVGLYDRGHGKRLGSVIEFRSQLEAGIRFDNEMRITAAVSHLSNAGITGWNPGVNIIGGYIHIPTNWIFNY